MSLKAKLNDNGGFAEPDDSFRGRFCTDITGSCACRPSFRAADGSREIDIPASFSPSGLFYGGGKAFNVGVAAYAIYLGLGRDPRFFWFAYLTNWNVTISTLYLLCSFGNSIFPVAQPAAGKTVVGARVKLTWALFTLAANIGLVVTIAFWSLIFDGVMDIATVFPHGILTFAVLVDGFLLNTIPIRLRHYLELVFPFATAYMIWSYLHSVFGIGNPDQADEDSETNDDLIYGVLDWESNPKATAVVAVSIVLVLSPVLQFVLWMFSGCRRRYVEEDGDNDRAYSKMGYV
jgi:hypothetical protein